MNLQVNNNYERIRAHTLSRARNTKFLGSKRACLIARAVPPPPLPHIQTLQDDLLQLTPTPFSHPAQGGGGGHTSARENNAIRQKEPENTPDTILFIPKGALIHTQNPHPKPHGHKPPQPATSHNPTQTPRTTPSIKTVAIQ